MNKVKEVVTADAIWVAQPIQAALRCMEDEVWPDYTTDDLQEQWACLDLAS